MADVMNSADTGVGQAVEDAGHPSAMTREKLYGLVWQTPMTKLAKKFGLSDVGLRKICKRHGIPTPPSGHWAKLVHGKRVHQLPLPPAAKGTQTLIYLTVKPSPHTSPVVAAAQGAALAQESRHPSIAVPEDRPIKLHPVAAATAKILRATKVDSEGFKDCCSPGGVNIKIGPKSIDRAVRVIDAFARAAEVRGHHFVESDGGTRIIVDEIPFVWHLHETRDRAEHYPNKEELKAQARQDEDRARWPSLYSSQSDRKVYRSWNYFPSGRLAITFIDGTQRWWYAGDKIGSWYDRKSKSLEECLDNAMAALAIGAINVKYRLAEEAERKQQQAEEAKQRQREQARHDRAMKRHEFLLRKMEEYSRYEKLSAFAHFMERKHHLFSDDAVNRLVRELGALVKVAGEGFEREALLDEIVKQQLYTEDDSISDLLDE